MRLSPGRVVVVNPDHSYTKSNWSWSEFAVNHDSWHDNVRIFAATDAHPPHGVALGRDGTSPIIEREPSTPPKCDRALAR